MSAFAPLAQPCPHLATPQEHARDPEYTACTAQAGEPCRWAQRQDGLPDPAFHAARLEAAMPPAPASTPEEAADFRKAVLASGLV